MATDKFYNLKRARKNESRNNSHNHPTLKKGREDRKPLRSERIPEQINIYACLSTDPQIGLSSGKDFGDLGP